jgi:hypothetical protein
MAYLVGNCGGDGARPRPRLGWPVHGAAQGHELILSSSTCSRVIARLSAHCADPLLRRPLCRARQARLLLQRQQPARATLRRPRWTGRRARCSAWWLPRHMCHELNALVELEQPALPPAPAALRQGVAGPSARIAWLGRKWSAPVCPSCG